MNIGRVGNNIYNINAYSQNNRNDIRVEDKKAEETKLVSEPIVNQKFNSNDYVNLYDKDREYILGDNDVSLEKLDIQKAVSDMKKDRILEQYQVFVRPSDKVNKDVSFFGELENFDL